MSIIGPSGSSKSTFLRCLNLLEMPDSGTVEFEGHVLNQKGVDINQYRRRMGMVLQSFNVFPHMSCIDNITMAPVLQKLKTKEEATAQAEELLHKVGLYEKRNEHPNKLSGGQNIMTLSQKELLQVRRQIGMIFQGFNLLEQRTVLRNICFPLEISGTPKAEAKKRAEELLRVVGLSDKAASYPSQLSGGQKQRVAIARALATKPRYLLCDEATSALDPNTTRSILELLREINKTLGVTIIVITHEMKVIDQICDRVAVIDKSCIAEEGRVADVFTSPKSDIARELVLPQERPVLEPTTGGRKVRIIFNGENTQKPVISEMILACRVPVNVLFADTKSVEGAAYGHMIFELPNDEHDAEKVISWLKNSGLTWKEER